MKRLTLKRLCLLLCAGLLSSAALAQSFPADVAGERDHPILTRYAGSWLVASETRPFDSVSFPGGPKDADRSTVEGKVTRLLYLAPAGRSVLEVQRNYEQALEKAGATRRDACAAPSCAARDFRFIGQSEGKKLATGALDGWDAKSLVDQWMQPETARWWYGTLTVRGTPVHVAVLSGKPGIVQLADKYAATMVQIVEPRAMDSGMVTVDAAALAKGLQADGKIALYGVFFDSGKSELKPESKAQLDEMAKLLQTNAALRVYIVGHTDNQGTLDANLALSRARAQAVVDALVRTYKIDGKRLAAAGVASYAPVASNASDAGRARNRRVELVLQ
jgi:outer membrane protein OmpA-like peptidoglycan-associated protein